MRRVDGRSKFESCRGAEFKLLIIRHPLMWHVALIRSSKYTGEEFHSDRQLQEEIRPEVRWTIDIFALRRVKVKVRVGGRSGRCRTEANDPAPRRQPLVARSGH